MYVAKTVHTPRAIAQRLMRVSHCNELSSSASSSAIGKVLVVGSGVVGLRTALELLERNVQVVVRSPYSPLDPRTASMGAGGFWMPFHVESPQVALWAHQTLTELLLPENSKWVEKMATVQLLRDHKGPTIEDYTTTSSEKTTSKLEPGHNSQVPEWAKDERVEFQHMTVEMLSWQNAVHQLRIPNEEVLKTAGYLHAWHFQTVVADSPNYLRHMLDLVQSHPNANVNVETNRFYASVDDMCEEAAALGCDAVVNCTGVAAKEICQDAHVEGARGVVLQFDRASCQRTDTVANSAYGPNLKDAVILCDEAPWGSENGPCYIIPRGDILVVGGTYLVGDTEPSVRASERERLLVNARNMGVNTEAAKPIAEWVGFRPSRTSLRCEVETVTNYTGMKVAHHYGHGGSGWTLFTGSSKYAVDLLLGAS